MANAKAQISAKFYNNSKTPTAVTPQHVETEIVDGRIVPVHEIENPGVHNLNN